MMQVMVIAANLLSTIKNFILVNLNFKALTLFRVSACLKEINIRNIKFFTVITAAIADLITY